jgi:hypothetical protein
MSCFQSRRTTELYPDQCGAFNLTKSLRLPLSVGTPMSDVAFTIDATLKFKRKSDAHTYFDKDTCSSYRGTFYSSLLLLGCCLRRKWLRFNRHLWPSEPLISIKVVIHERTNPDGSAHDYSVVHVLCYALVSRAFFMSVPLFFSAKDVSGSETRYSRVGSGPPSGNIARS